MWLRWRKSFARRCRPNFPGRRFSFEPGDLVNQIMNFGAPTPVEVAVIGPNLAASRAYTDRLRDEMSKIRRSARSEIRAAARLSQRGREGEPRNGRAARRDGGPGGAVALRSDLFQPLHDAQLLGRSEYRHRLSGAGAVPAAEHHLAAGCAKHPGDAGPVAAPADWRSCQRG